MVVKWDISIRSCYLFMLWMIVRFYLYIVSISLVIDEGGSLFLYISGLVYHVRQMIYLGYVEENWNWSEQWGILGESIRYLAASLSCFLPHFG